MARAAYTIVARGGGGAVLGHHAWARNRQVADRAAVYPSRASCADFIWCATRSRTWTEVTKQLVERREDLLDELLSD
jgi:hypothetical protein